MVSMPDLEQFTDFLQKLSDMGAAMKAIITRAMLDSHVYEKLQSTADYIIIIISSSSSSSRSSSSGSSSVSTSLCFPINSLMPSRYIFQGSKTIRVICVIVSIIILVFYYGNCRSTK